MKVGLSGEDVFVCMSGLKPLGHQIESDHPHLLGILPD